MRAKPKNSTRATSRAARSGRRAGSRPPTRRPPAPRADAAPPDRHSGALKHLGGSQSDEWNDRLAAEAVQAMPQLACETRDQKMDAALQGLAGIAPQDELEGIMAAQLIAAHAAAMDCYRRAAKEERDGERQDHLNQAARLSRASATLLTALVRYRRSGGRDQKSAKQPHARDLPPARAPRLDGLRRNEERPDREPAQQFPKWSSLSDEELKKIMVEGPEDLRWRARLVVAGRRAETRKERAAAAAATAMPVAAQPKSAEQPHAKEPPAYTPPPAPAESAKQPSAALPPTPGVTHAPPANRRPATEERVRVNEWVNPMINTPRSR